MQRTNFLETPQQTPQVRGQSKSWIATEVLLVETSMFYTTVYYCVHNTTKHFKKIKLIMLAAQTTNRLRVQSILNHLILFSSQHAAIPRLLALHSDFYMFRRRYSFFCAWTNTWPEAEVKCIQDEKVLGRERPIVKVVNSFEIPFNFWNIPLDLVHYLLNFCRKKTTRWRGEEEH